MAVAVVVDEGASRSPSGRASVPEAGFLGDIGKGAIAVVAVEAILAKIGAEEIVEAVVVVVGNANAIGPARGFQAGLFGDIGEGTVAIVFVETIGGFRRIFIEARAREHEDIHPSVVVVIDKSATAPIRLEDVFFRFKPAVNDGSMQAGLSSDVSKLCMEGTARGRRLGLRRDIAGGNPLLLAEELPG